MARSPFVLLWLQSQDRRRGPDGPRKLRYQEGTTLSAPTERASRPMTYSIGAEGTLHVKRGGVTQLKAGRHRR